MRVCSSAIGASMRASRFSSTVLALALASVAWAGDLSRVVHLDLPADSLGASLRLLAKQADLQISFPPEDVAGLQSEALQGDYTARDALSRLLKDTHLQAVENRADSIAVRRNVAESKSEPKEGRRPMPPAPAESSAGNESQHALQEIVVTARKEAERLQDVPISMTALSEQTLQRSGAASLADIAREVPALNVVSLGPGQNQIIIRGISSSGGVPTVGYYIDDTPIQSIGVVDMDPTLLDLERVEVLRGPQGTLYGASSLGGTVKYVTRQPDLVATQASVQATLSDTDGAGANYAVSGLVNEPLISGSVALRLLAFYGDQAGYIDRYPINPNNYLASLPGPVTKDINTEKTYGLRLSVRMRPSEALFVTPAIWIQRTELGAPFTFDDPPASLERPFQARDAKEPITNELRLVTLTIEGDVRGAHLTSSTAYRDRWFDAVEDESKVDYYFLSPVPQSYVYPSPDDNYFANHDFTEEIRGFAGAGALHALMGLFYLHQDNFYVADQPIPSGYNAAFGTPFGYQPFYLGTTSYHAAQEAAYGEVNLDLTRRFQATVGARVFRVTQYEYIETTGVFNGGYSAGGGSSYDSGINPKFELSYHVAPDFLAYATAAKGFRQGGPAVGFPAEICAADLAALGLHSPPTSFKADTLWSYELGGKTAWLDHRLTVNGAVYYMNWSNVQQLISLPTCGVAFVGNFGTALSEGSEVEIHYEPILALRLTLGAAYNEAKLTSTTVGAQGQKGDTLESAPRWMGSGSAEYRREFTGATSGYARADFSTVTHQYNNFETTSIYRNRPGYSLLNARVGAKHQAWNTALFIDNALNKRAETALPESYAIDLPTTRSISLNQPRTVGLEVRHDF
jgi:iron complex outermembrane recepter protein